MSCRQRAEGGVGVGVVGAEVWERDRVSWGQVIGSNRQYILDASYTVTAPGVAIFVTVLSISMVGDGLNDALNPKLRQR